VIVPGVNGQFNLTGIQHLSNCRPGSAIRFSREADGWVGDFAENSIAGRFHRLDEFFAVAG
jgi:cupin superfamily acireductone dioxygenase involved in methionine salvage